jgi:heme-degrading monooxygenase HmoA
MEQEQEQEQARFAELPRPPYFAVIFSSRRKHNDDESYEAASSHMLSLAKEVPGFLGMESTRGVDGFGITVSYWTSEDAISAWKAQSENSVIRERGRWLWYDHFEVRVAKVERAYGSH